MRKLDLEQRKPLEHVATRIDSSLRNRARALAVSNGVPESEVYRKIIQLYFSDESAQNK